MLRYFARVLRALVISTVGMGGGCGLLVFIAMIIVGNQAIAFDFGWKAGLIIGMLFSLIMLGVMLPLDLSYHLFLAHGLSNAIWELEQTREIEVDGNIKEVISACRQALLVVPYVTNVSDDSENLVTRASTGPSWKSAGEDIEVEINPVAENKWCLKGTSRSKGKNVFFDYGKNFENVEAWRKHLLSVLEERKKAQTNTV
ncbi:MAG TPA: hypothetical protein V6C72_13785 [Chroococcales cyanobacterium]